MSHRAWPARLWVPVGVICAVSAVVLAAGPIQRPNDLVNKRFTANVVSVKEAEAAGFRASGDCLGK